VGQAPSPAAGPPAGSAGDWKRLTVREFTGERVIPGQVEPDLWNEHVARYAFAARYARGRQVLDAGCGAGFGAARLAAVARRVVGVDVAAEAVELARREYGCCGASFLRADCRRLPFPDAAFELVVAFEVIEHLEEWERLLAEARRVLLPGGAFLVSTPNRIYYSEYREAPNPFHVHEFEYAEFAAALGARFPEVRIFCENHAAGIVFTSDGAAAVESAIEPVPLQPDTAHFFVAVCSVQPQDGSPPSFVYLPETGNVLRDREKHIQLLESELGQKNRWLEEARQSLDELHRCHQALQREAAAERLRSQQIVRALEEEGARKTEWCRRTEVEVARLQGLLEKLQAEFEERSRWALELESERAELAANFSRLSEEAEKTRQDLKACVDQLHSTEAELESRTAWAQDLDRQLAAAARRVSSLTETLAAILRSPAYRIGKRLGLAPARLPDVNP